MSAQIQQEEAQGNISGHHLSHLRPSCCGYSNLLLQYNMKRDSARLASVQDRTYQTARRQSLLECMWLRLRRSVNV